MKKIKHGKKTETKGSKSLFEVITFGLDIKSSHNKKETTT
jgi:hypothetical protein